MLLFPFRYMAWLVSSLRARIGRPPDYVAFLIEESMPVLPDPPVPAWQRFFRRGRLSVRELGRRFEAIGKDSRIKGVVLHLRPVPMPLAVLQDLREQVATLRKTGKRVVAWAPFYTTGTYYLACACDEILLLPTGVVQPLGFSSTGMFLAQALARVGVQADFVQVSPYKTAADVLTKSKMSDEMREQIRWLLQSEQEQLLSAIANGRGMDADAARQVVDASPYTDDQAAARHVVDGVLPEEELPKHLSGVTIGDWDQARRRMPRPAPKLRPGSYVALIRIEGTIIDGRSGRPPVAPPIEVPLVGDPRAGDLTVVQVARQVAADKRAAAAVVYVDSRGGSATASEAMRQALAAVAAKKPVVTAMGPVAGSGGYWVAMPGRWIVARPGTITGSIGVLTGKLVTGGLWSRLLVNRETVAEGRHAVMEGDEKPYTAEERQIVQSMIDRVYSLFLDVVASARRVTRAELEPLAGGKVWTGAQAIEHKLVDELGGLDTAIAKARSLAGLSDSVPAIEVHPPKRSLPPQTLPTAAGLAAYLFEGITMFNRTPVMALMELLEP